MLAHSRRRGAAPQEAPLALAQLRQPWEEATRAPPPAIVWTLRPPLCRLPPSRFTQVLNKSDARPWSPGGKPEHLSATPQAPTTAPVPLNRRLLFKTTLVLLAPPTPIDLQLDLESGRLGADSSSTISQAHVFKGLKESSQAWNRSRSAVPPGFGPFPCPLVHS